MKLEKKNYLNLLCYVQKSSERFQSEKTILEFNLLEKVIRIISSSVELNQIVKQIKEKSLQQSEDGQQKMAKTTFKIEISQNEKEVRDSAQTTLYHT